MDALTNAFRESADTGKPVFLDFHAEWCKNCKAMDQTTFRDTAVQNELKQFIFVKFDATDMTNPDVKSILKKFDVSGLPTYVIARAAGK